MSPIIAAPGQLPHEHDCFDEAIEHITLEIIQKTGETIVTKARSCGECYAVIEEPVRVRARGFPRTGNGWLRLVAALFGKLGWESLKKAHAKIRARQWTHDKTHQIKHPFRKGPGDELAICDKTGEKIDLRLLRADPRLVSCYGCKRNPRFRAIWEQYAKLGEPWAQTPPDAFPAANTAEEISAAWEVDK